MLRVCAALSLLVASSAAAAETNPSLFHVPVGSSPAKGPADALVTIIQFADFECKHSFRVQESLAEILKTKKGVRLVFKHLPVKHHPNAELAARYAIAASKSGKFWQLHHQLFAHRDKLAPSSLIQYVTAIGLDAVQLEAAANAAETRKKLAQDIALAEKLGLTGTPTFFVNGLKMSGAQPLANFEAMIELAQARAQALVDSGVARSEIYAKVIADGQKAVPQQKKRTKRVAIELVEDAPIKGAKRPFVTLILFADFQCPYSGRLHQTLKRIMRRYDKKVQLRFRHNPLDSHKRAKRAARAAVAAKAQNKFWGMADRLFSDQKNLDNKKIERHARQIGLRMKRFKKDRDATKTREQIQRDRSVARKSRARGTPTLFINGIRVAGAKSFESIVEIIDKEIAQAKSLRKKGVPWGELYQKAVQQPVDPEEAQEEESTSDRRKEASASSPNK